MVLKLIKEQKELRRRILEMIHEVGQSHIGSCFTAIDIISAVYQVKKRDDKFVLSYGHAAGAWYAVLEKHGLLKKASFKNLMIHPDRNLKIGIEVSSGSLGQGLPIALGMALAERTRDIYCLISDGECTEGSIWEALRIYEDLKVHNLKIILAANGYGAYDRISLSKLKKRLTGYGLKVKEVEGHNISKLESSLKKWPEKKPFLLFANCSSEQLPFLKGVGAHYHRMSEEEYVAGLEKLRFEN